MAKTTRKSAVAKKAARPRRKAARPKQPDQALKYSKYLDKPLDVQIRIALFGPRYESGDVETLIYEVTRGILLGGTPFLFPPPEAIWLEHLKNAIRSGDNEILKRAAREAKRAYLALTQPFDRLALQLLEETLPGRDYVITVDEFLAKYYKNLRPQLAPWEHKKRQIRMLEGMLGVKLG